MPFNRINETPSPLPFLLSSSIGVVVLVVLSVVVVVVVLDWRLLLWLRWCWVGEESGPVRGKKKRSRRGAWANVENNGEMRCVLIERIRNCDSNDEDKKTLPERSKFPSRPGTHLLSRERQRASNTMSWILYPQLLTPQLPNFHRLQTMKIWWFVKAR